MTDPTPPTDHDAVTLRRPDEWCDLLGARILDHDGWRDGARDWMEPITRAEFDERLMRCTIDARGYPQHYDAARLATRPERTGAQPDAGEFLRTIRAALWAAFDGSERLERCTRQDASLLADAVAAALAAAGQGTTQPAPEGCLSDGCEACTITTPTCDPQTVVCEVCDDQRSVLAEIDHARLRSLAVRMQGRFEAEAGERRTRDTWLTIARVAEEVMTQPAPAPDAALAERLLAIGTPMNHDNTCQAIDRDGPCNCWQADLRAVVAAALPDRSGEVQ